MEVESKVTEPRPEPVDEKPPIVQDEAAKIFNGDLEDLSLDFTENEAARVRWKLDLIIVPIMCVTYMLSFIDKAILSTAAVYGLETDLHLHGQQYSWCSSIFYFGYLVWQYPNSIFMQKLPVGKWIGAMIFLWGLSLAASAGSKNFASFATSRFFLGAFEAANNPAFTLLVGQYFTRREQALRASIWWAGGPIGAFVGDGLSFSVGHWHGSLARWQYLFLVFGPITMAWGLVIFFVMPSSPTQAWFLTEKERKIAVFRVLGNHTGLKNRQYKLSQVKECLRDPQVWMLTAIVLLQCIPGGGLTAFNKIILTGLGYSSVESTLMAMPEHAIQLVSVLLAGGFCSYFGRGRCIAMILSNISVLIGSVLLYTLPTSMKLSRLGSVYALLTCTVSEILCMTMISSNIAGFTKKMTASVLLFVGYCVGQIITPQFFISSENPTYPTGFRAYFVTSSMMIVLQLILMLYLLRENKKRDREHGERVNLDENDRHCISETDLLDLTDWEQRSFRYIW